MQIDCRGEGGRCEFLIRSENEGELVEFVRGHVADVHGLTVSVEDVRQWTTDVPAGGESSA